MVKKERKFFFKDRTKKEIEDSCNISIVTKNFVQHIIDSIEHNDLEVAEVNDTGLVFELKRGSFIPDSYSGSRHFSKKGPLLILDRYNHINDVIDSRVSIQESVERKINGLQTAMLSGIGFFPLLKNRDGSYAEDAMMRKFRLTSCSNAILTLNYILNHGQIIYPDKIDVNKNIEGINLYKKSLKKRGKPSIEIDSFSFIDNLAFEGGIFKGKISSRTKGNSPYEIVASNIPIANNHGNEINARKFVSSHSSKEKLYGNIAYIRQDIQRPVDVINCYSQDISFYLACALYLEEIHNTTAARDYNPFFVLSENLMKIDNFLANNCLIKKTESKGTRKLSQMEKERGLWGVVNQKGFDYCFTKNVPIRQLKDYNLGRSYRK